MILALSRIPFWARLLIVVRENEILDPATAGPLRAGDYVYLLTPPERVPRLDQLFAESPDVVRRTEPRLGELPINAAARLADIANLYDLELAEEDREATVADYFARHLAAPPQPGSRVPIGNAMLIVRLVEDGRVVRAGLQLREIVEALVAAALARRPGIERMAGRLRARGSLRAAAKTAWRWLRRRAGKAKGGKGG
jgi:cell volume regulation protein A